MGLNDINTIEALDNADFLFGLSGKQYDVTANKMLEITDCDSQLWILAIAGTRKVIGLIFGDKFRFSNYKSIESSEEIIDKLIDKFSVIDFMNRIKLVFNFHMTSEIFKEFKKVDIEAHMLGLLCEDYVIEIYEEINPNNEL